MSNIIVPPTVKVWKIGQAAGNVRSNHHYVHGKGYSLQCLTNRQYLNWIKQPLGINLGFQGTPATPRVHFRLPDGKERDILSGELVAFGIGGGEAFLHYCQRTVGVNLCWSLQPVFQWRIFGGPEGTPIKKNEPVALFDQDAQPADFLTFFGRPPGMADLGWTTSKGIADRLKDAAVKRGKEAIFG